MPLRTVPTDPSADRSVPAALLAQQSFDVSMAKQGSQRRSPLDDGTSFTLPRLNPTATETEVACLVYHVISQEMRERFGDILIDLSSLGYTCQHQPNTALPAPSCMRFRTAVPAALLSARRPTLMCPLSHALRCSLLLAAHRSRRAGCLRRELTSSGKCCS